MPDAPGGETVTLPPGPVDDPARPGGASPDTPPSGPVGPGPRRRRHRLRTVLLVVAVVVVGTVVAGVVWYQGQVNEGPAGRAVIVDVPAGSSVGSVVATLARQQVVGSSLAFHIFLALHGTPTVQAGRYELRRHQGFGAVRDALAGGPDGFPSTDHAFGGKTDALPGGINGPGAAINGPGARLTESPPKTTLALFRLTHPAALRQY